MSYWIDEPRLARLEGATEIWRDGNFIAYKMRWGAIAMVLDGYSLGETNSGTLERTYKGDYKKWIKTLRNKDEEKTWRTRENCKEALATCDFIDDLWRRAGMGVVE